MKKQWLISLMVFVLSVGTAGIVSAIALTSGGGPPSFQDDTGTPNASSMCAEDRPDCNATMVIGADEEGTIEPEPCDPETVDGCEFSPVRSDDGIDPGVCNIVHNIDVCSEEELEALGYGELSGPPCCKKPVTGVSDKSEQDSEIGIEPNYPAVALMEGNETHCGIAGGVVYVTSDGSTGCVDGSDVEDSGGNPGTVTPEEPPTAELVQ